MSNPVAARVIHEVACGHAMGARALGVESFPHVLATWSRASQTPIHDSSPLWTMPGANMSFQTCCFILEHALTDRLAADEAAARQLTLGMPASQQLALADFLADLRVQYEASCTLLALQQGSASPLTTMRAWGVGMQFCSSWALPPALRAWSDSTGCYASQVLTWSLTTSALVHVADSTANLMPSKNWQYLGPKEQCPGCARPLTTFCAPPPVMLGKGGRSERSVLRISAGDKWRPILLPVWEDDVKNRR